VQPPGAPDVRRADRPAVGPYHKKTLRKAPKRFAVFE